MKVLLLHPENHAPYTTRILTGLRQRIGTCEAFPVKESQLNNLEQFFASFIRLGQYDRIVLEFSQQVIYKQSLFLRQLPHLAVLSLNQNYTLKERRLLRRNLNVMPWMRFLSDDHRLVQELVAEKYDAYWMRPVYNPDYYHVRRTEAPNPNGVVYDETGDIKHLFKKRLDAPRFITPKEEFINILHPQDIFIYWPKNPQDVPQAMIQAMACGAVVIAKDPGANMKMRYHFRDHENCLLEADATAAVEAISIAKKAPDMMKAISENAAKDVQVLFSPYAIGELLGAVLEPAVKQSADFRRKVRIFGMEF